MTAAIARKRLPTAPDSRKGMTGLLGGRPLDSRNNSLNLIRLILASAVLFAHAYYIAGLGVGPHIDGENLGGWAVFGFFTISGYLITASRFGNSLGTYLVHRIARIMPAFWVCLLITAVVFAPIGYLTTNGTLDGFLTSPTAPANYVFANFFLKIGAYDVAGTPSGVPDAGAWDGSLWSLYYEFLCYLVIGALGIFALVRRSPWVLGMVFLVTVAAHAKIEFVLPYLGGNPDVQLLAKLIPLFLGGALVHVLRDRLPLHWPGAVAAAAVSGTCIALLDGWGAQLSAPLITYVILWIASVIPSPRWTKKNDISYGFYIYAFPVQQLVALAGGHTHGLLIFNALAVAGTIPLALASWLLIEQPIMRRVRRRTTAQAWQVPGVAAEPKRLLPDPRGAPRPARMATGI